MREQLPKNRAFELMLLQREALVIGIVTALNVILIVLTVLSVALRSFSCHGR